MNLRQVWDRITRDSEPGIEFEEFEDMLADWAWNERDRQESAVGKVKNIQDRDVEGF